MSASITGTWHLIGVGGIGVSAVARLLHSRGATVQGSDVRESQLTLALRDLGVTVHIGHDAQHLIGVDTVVVSTAIPETNPELVAARAQHLKIVHRSEVLGRLLEDRHSVGVIGTHGKGTVSGATTWLLDAGGYAPGYIIGGLLLNYDNNARDGATWMVAEVDESDGSLINSHPTVAILNNLELDHLNYYKDWDQLERLVLSFFRDNPRLELAVLNLDDVGARRIYDQLGDLRERGVRVVGFGFESEDAVYRGVNLNNGRMRGAFDLVHQEQGPLGPIEIGLPGAYNSANLLGAIAIALEVGVPFETVQQAAPTYLGLENRFTLVHADGVEVVKDYISHPTGIRRVLKAARAQAEGEVVAVFKPYRFTMIHYLQDDYAEAFQDADRVVITELYTAGEVPIAGTDTDLLCRRIRERCAEVTYVHDLHSIPAWLQTHVVAPATVLFFGGDDLFEVADAYVAQRGGAA